MADRKQASASITAPTHTLASLATSSTLVAGQESDAIDNSTTKYTDIEILQKVTTGTSPTVSKTIELWIIPEVNGQYPDVFDGSDSAETVTTRDILRACGRLAASVLTTATSNVTYWLECPSVAELFGGHVPDKFVLFIVHDTAVNLNSTGGNHAAYVRGFYETVA